MRRAARLVVVVSLLVTPALAGQDARRPTDGVDRVLLKSGRRLAGELGRADGTTVRFRDAELGWLAIARDRVRVIARAGADRSLFDEHVEPTRREFTASSDRVTRWHDRATESTVFVFAWTPEDGPDRAARTRGRIASCDVALVAAGLPQAASRRGATMTTTVDADDTSILRALRTHVREDAPGRWIGLVVPVATKSTLESALLATDWTFVGVDTDPPATSVATAPSRPDPASDRAAARAALVAAHRELHGGDVAFSVWLGAPDRAAEWTWHADTWRPAASAIKTAYLVELFCAFAGRLDEPLDAIDAVVADFEHPAVEHFRPADRERIRDEISGVSVRRLGQMMIHGVGVDNVVYNAAANVTTAILGGPDELTRRIRARAPGFDGAAVRRYMLARRDVTGDNEVTAETLGQVLLAVASRRVPGASAATGSALRDILFIDQLPTTGTRHFFKSGALSSDPLVIIRSGWFEDRDGAVRAYAVIGSQPDPGARPRDAAYAHLRDVTVALTRELLATWPR